MKHQQPPQDERPDRADHDPAEQGRTGDRDHPQNIEREKRLRLEDDDGDELVGAR